jgi:hypothetical protein
LLIESALESNNGLAGADSTKTKSEPWPEWDIQAEPEPYEESYLPGKLTRYSERESAINEEYLEGATNRSVST